MLYLRPLIYTTFFFSDAERSLVERLASLRATHKDFTVLPTGTVLQYAHKLYVNMYPHCFVLRKSACCFDFVDSDEGDDQKDYYTVPTSNKRGLWKSIHNFFRYDNIICPKLVISCVVNE